MDRNPNQTKRVSTTPVFHLWNNSRGK